ncbi:MAG: hypothetical protein EHM62_03885 [Methylococcus sp.]|nr:MAG: hypothetical protein EHM62_03885 [Methylococcus sp.]
MANELYDLILFGLHDDVTDPQQAIRTLAAALKIDEGFIAEAVQGASGVVLRRGMPKDMAERYRVALAKAGAVCNIRPASAAAVGLSLAPIVEASAEAHEFSCPACGYTQNLQENDPRLLTCPSCGVVPEKYLKLQEEQAERERIKARLLKQNEAQRAQREAEAAERAEQARREALEEEIRKELALPSALSSRVRRMMTGVAVWSAGLLMGAGALALHHAYSTGDENALSSGQPASGIGEATGSALTTTPGNAASVDVMLQRYEARLPQSTGRVEGRATALRSGFLPGRKAGQPGAKPMTVDWARALDGEVADAAWNRWLELAVDRALSAGQSDQALKLARSLPPGETSWRAVLSVAADRQGQAAARDELLKGVQSDILAVPDKLEQVQGLTLLAEAWASMGQSAQAKAVTEHIQAQVEPMRPGEGKAAALAYQAALLARQGQTTLAESVWRDAIRMLVGEKDPLIQLNGYVRLADSYIQAGDRATAVGLLTDALGSAGRLASGESRQRLIGDIAREFTRAGDLDSALAAAGQLPGDQAQAGLILELVQTSLEQGDPWSALKAAESLAAPAYRARALAAVAVSFKLENRQDALARETLAQATALAKELQQPEATAWVKADLARSTALLGDVQAAESWSGQATQAVGLVKDSKLKDRLWAYLALRQARANLPAGAKSSAGFIQDAGLAADVRATVERAVAIEIAR